ncbi:tRNA pseudouridine(38-40) synthase TruA [bacterium I07]|nr:tRNA pseudouridine(38-40) synthase TruA [bacterium I07]
MNNNGLRSIKLILEYDGTDFHGFQIQPEGRTVQRVIEKGLFDLTRKPVRIRASGRTDAGVHALGQVIDFRIQSDLEIKVFQAGLNAHLPGDVRIIQAEEADADFDARRHAVGRTYQYNLLDRPSVIHRRYAWFPGILKQTDLMKEASRLLIGRHDFTSFCKASGEDEYMSNIYSIKWINLNGITQFQITAMRFFHNMVRIILGTLLEVGKARMTYDCFKSILQSKSRIAAGPTIPPQGLFLANVHYTEASIEPYKI